MRFTTYLSIFSLVFATINPVFAFAATTEPATIEARVIETTPIAESTPAPQTPVSESQTEVMTNPIEEIPAAEAQTIEIAELPATLKTEILSNRSIETTEVNTNSETVLLTNEASESEEPICAQELMCVKAETEIISEELIISGESETEIFSEETTERATTQTQTNNGGGVASDVYRPTAQTPNADIVGNETTSDETTNNATTASEEPEIFMPTIIGTVFDDVNGNGMFDAGEPGLQDWGVELYPNAGNSTDIKPIGAAITNANGVYTFVNLSPGDYIIRVVTKTEERWMQTYPFLTNYPTTAKPAADQKPPHTFPHGATHDGSYEISVITGQTINGKDFGAFQRPIFRGSFWYDLNVDGIWQQTGAYPEPIIANQTIIAIRNADNSQKQIKTSNRGAYVFQFTPDELGQWDFFEAPQMNWRHTFPKNPEVHSQTISQSGEKFKDNHFGIVRYFDILGMKMAPFSGIDTATHAALILDAIALTLNMNNGTTVFGVSTETLVTRTDGVDFDINAFEMRDVDPTTLSGFDSSVNVFEAVAWGIPNTELQFSNLVSIDVFMGTGFDGETFDIIRSSTGDGNWTNDGVVTTSCTVINGMCFFSATKASIYALTKTIASPPGGSGGTGGGGGSGGGGGGGGGNIPVPPTSGSGGTPSSSGNTNTTPPSSNIPGGVGGSQFPNQSTNGTITGEFVQAETGVQQESTETGETENEEVIEEQTNEGNQNGAFLAGLGNILTLGTGNTFLGILVLAAIVFLILFLFARRSEKEKEIAA